MGFYNDWRVWLIAIIIILFIFWLTTSSQDNNCEFVGVRPLIAGNDISEYRNILAPLPLQEDIDITTSTINTISMSTTGSSKNKPVTQPITPKTLNITSEPVSYVLPKAEPFVLKYIPVYPENPVCPVTMDANGKTAGEINNKIKPRKFGSIGEQICCETMEKIYGVPFNSTWPNWLRNPETGANLEIDCYNENLKIGVEYNGAQHYIYPNVYHKTKEEFLKQVRRDQYKLETCDQNGVYLITVPYNVPHKKIEEYIRYHLPEAVNKREICDI